MLNTHNWSVRMWTGLNRLRIGFNNRRLKEKRDFLYNHSTTKTYLLPSFQQKQSTKREFRGLALQSSTTVLSRNKVRNFKGLRYMEVYRCNTYCKYNIPSFASLPTPPRPHEASLGVVMSWAGTETLWNNGVQRNIFITNQKVLRVGHFKTLQATQDYRYTVDRHDDLVMKWKGLERK
jgi:hypothetical protein